MSQDELFELSDWSTWASQAAPLFKWAGGKQRFLWHHRDLLPLSLDGRTYHEPFAGGLSVFFHLCAHAPRPFEAKLADTNLQLIKTYQAVARDWRQIGVDLRAMERALQESPDPAEYFYRVRAEHNAIRPRVDAARFIFLMRVGWNGVYRTNRSGAFNVPFGGKVQVRMPSDAELRATATALGTATIRATSWESSLTAAKEGDFVFLDPPYFGGDNEKANLYDLRRPFLLSDQEALAAELGSLQRRGVEFVLTNSAHPTLISLYRDYGLSVTVTEALRSVSGKVDGRGVIGELIVRPSAATRSKVRASASLRLRGLSVTKSQRSTNSTTEGERNGNGS